jgi:hypothetical protein
MAVENPDVIDAVGTEIATGIVVLSLIDSLTWDAEYEHLLALQAKLNRYLDFIESGELSEKYAGAKPGVPLRVDVWFKHLPTLACERFLEIARDTLDTLGLGFSWTCPNVPDSDRE